MADMTPSTPDGSYWEFLSVLWRSAFAEEADEEEAKAYAGCTIADVAFFHHGFVRAWYFTARDGTLRRKSNKKLSVVELTNFLCRGAPQPSSITPTPDDPGEVVAVGLFGPGGAMDAKGRQGSALAALERGPLRWLLEPNDTGRRRELQAIIKYVRPRGEREAVLRFDWRAQVCSFELRSANAPLQAGSTATIVPAYQRLSTHGPALCHSGKEKHVPPAAVREASAVCESLAERLIERGVPRERTDGGAGANRHFSTADCPL